MFKIDLLKHLSVLACFVSARRDFLEEERARARARI